MFYDLNVPWIAGDSHLPRTLAFMQELGYQVVALNHSISGKLPSDLNCPIPLALALPQAPSKLTILRRCTLVLTESHQNARLAELGRNYDLLAVRPIDERSLALACSSLDCDIISLDLTQRFPFWFKYKMLGEAVKNGKRLELCYGQAVALGSDSGMRRNVIANATQLIRASRGRGLVISSEATTAVACRGPWDAINLGVVWGLGQEKGYEAVTKECRSVIVGAKLKRTSYRGVIDIVHGGQQPARSRNEWNEEGNARAKSSSAGLKRKAGEIDPAKDSGSDTSMIGASVQPLSKRQMKKQSVEARYTAHTGGLRIDEATSENASGPSGHQSR